MHLFDGKIKVNELLNDFYAFNINTYVYNLFQFQL